MTERHFDVIVIGGGITGAGTARDCAMRGLRTLLLEREDIADGATGRNHGLLHSGARYAVKDAESARECIKENKILRRIASSCIEDTGGLFITLPEDEEAGYGLDYQSKFVYACRDAGIDAEPVTPRQALKMEPSANPALIGAVKVPDGSVDPFRLCCANVLDAQMHGAEILTRHEVTSFVREADSIIGVEAVDKSSGTHWRFLAPVTVNAAGIWGHGIASLAGIKLSMYPAKGALLVFGHRVNNVALNRCRKSADGDILVPGVSVTVIGTTSTRIPYEECDNVRVTPDEVRLLLREGCKLAPSLATTRILRAYGGVRPLVADDSDPTGRNISRGIVCIDHKTRDSIDGLVTITGGKLMTYRLMAQMATDTVCRKLGVSRECRTAVTPLAGSAPGKSGTLPGIVKKVFGGKANLGQKAAAQRLGSMVTDVSYTSPEDKRVVCECEQVTAGEIKHAVKSLGVKTLEDLRRRTRTGMGTCQGTFCIWKAARALATALGDPSKADELAGPYLNERWKGMMPVGWGETLREMEFMQRVYKNAKPDSYGDEI